MYYNYADLNFINKELEGIWPGWTAVKVLGKGAFGAVYEIHRNVRSKLEKAALKVLRVPENDFEIDQLQMQGMSRESTDKYYLKYVDSIRNEIYIMQKLIGNSHLVSYEDYLVRKRTEEVGWDIYIRMELLTGLSEYMEKHPLDEPAVLKLGLDLSQGLRDCHRKGILHRDIKPQNIFVTETGDFKLGDFGVARTAPGAQDVLSFKGTLAYMAPEVYRMVSTDARSDIYSLGIVLYQCLNDNRLPFVTEQLTPDDIETGKLRRLSGEQVPDPAHGSPGLKKVIRKALAANPEDRYQTAEELYKALADVDRKDYGGRAAYAADYRTEYSAAASGTVKSSEDVAFSAAPTSIIAAGSEPPSGESEQTSIINEQPSGESAPLPSEHIAPSSESAPPSSENTAKKSTATKSKTILPLVAALVVLAIVLGIFIYRPQHKQDGPDPVAESAGPETTDTPSSQEISEDKDEREPVDSSDQGETAAASGQGENAAAGQGGPAGLISQGEPEKSEEGEPSSEAAEQEPEDYPIDWKDDVLEAKMRDITGIETGDIMYSDVKDLTNINLMDSDEKPYYGKIKNISALSCMKNLEILYLSGCKVRDFRPLSSLTTLRSLFLDNCEIYNISFLKDLTNLRVLSLENNKINDLSALRDLTQMDSLNVMENRLYDINDLGNMKDLTEIGLGSNHISDIRILSDKTGLERVIIYDNNISDISALSDLPELEVLNAWGNQISDISALSGHTKLRYLNLGGNQISDISALRDLTEMPYLILYDNEIRDISALSGFTNLKILNISDNPISDYSPISGLDIEDLAK